MKFPIAAGMAMQRQTLDRLPDDRLEITLPLPDAREQERLWIAAFAEAGLRCAPSARARTEAAAWAAAGTIGYPLVVKPTAGAGGRDTYICEDATALAAALQATRHVPEVVIEAFVTGEEFTYEAVTVNGRPFLESVCRYLPNVLDARQNEWISPIIFCVRDVEDPFLGTLKLPGFPLRFSEQSDYGARGRQAPLLGEHNEAVLGELLNHETADSRVICVDE